MCRYLKGTSLEFTYLMYKHNDEHNKDDDDDDIKS